MQVKRRMGQSRDNVKIVRDDECSDETSQLFKQETSKARGKKSAKVLQNLQEVNAH